MSVISRRHFLIGSLALPLAGCAADEWPDAPALFSTATPADRVNYAAMPDERFPVPAVDLRKLPRKYRRQTVEYASSEAPGTIIVDTKSRFLHLVQDGGTAIRYGVGVGREGFAWGGRARIAYKREWPTWTPPSEMVDRQPELEPYREGMEPGLQNPLGARALYLFEGNRDTLYRLHGTFDASSIGKSVSSGCIRLINQDVIDLYNRVNPGTMVVVKQESDQIT
jgi:lipoprotein-anchoring transpeptidase ErfK/SrfK